MFPRRFMTAWLGAAALGVSTPVTAQPAPTPGPTPEPPAATDPPAPATDSEPPAHDPTPGTDPPQPSEDAQSPAGAAQPSEDPQSPADAQAPATDPPLSAPIPGPVPAAQDGAGAEKANIGIEGMVVDSDTGEPLGDVVVEVVGNAARATTDAAGRFSLAVPPGKYTLRVAGELFERLRVRGVIVRSGITKLRIKLTAEAIEEVVVEVLPDTSTDAVQVVRRRKRATVSDAISAEQMQRSPDSNASDAAKRMVAATIEDGRYVVIRGLGGRYSSTLLNGVSLPSPDPDVPAAPLDLFPAALVANLTVAKTFSPDMPGNFAGGALSIETRSFPSKFTLKTRIGVSADSQSSFRSVNGYRGGSLDILGYDDGTRALPAAIPTDRLASDPNLSLSEINRQASSFRNNWSLKPTTAVPNLSLGATVGDTLKLPRSQRLGYFAAASFGRSTVRRDIHLARVGESDGQGGYLPSVLQLDDQQGIRNVSLSGLLTAGWSKSSEHQINLVALYAHSAEIAGSRITGTDNSTTEVDRTRMRFLERDMEFAQLVGEHRLGNGRAIAGWQLNLAHVGQQEPDTRDLLRVLIPDGRYVIDHGSGSAERLFSDLGDVTGGGGADVTVPIGPVKLKTGGSVSRSERSYQTRRFHFDLFDGAELLEPDQAFRPENAGVAMAMSESTLPSDGYKASRTVLAGYGLADISLGESLRLVGGARVEQSSLDIGLTTDIDLMIPPAKPITQTHRVLLPAVNAVFAVSKRSNLRAAYGITVARPNFREVSPALYFDYVRRRAIGGNPDLTETRIHNADLRWETFLGDTELLAASLFYKHFASPIERTVVEAGDGQNIGFANAKSADSYGIELEMRIGLQRLAQLLAPLSFGANLSLIRSQLELDGISRPLQGQSPYVINVGLGYQPLAGTQIDVLYNASGRRIDEVGTGGAGNVYEQPMHRLDLTFSQKLPRRLRLKLAGTNLLGARVVRVQNGVETFAYQQGVTVAGSIEMSID